MLYGLLADLLVLFHAGFILFAALGGLLCLRWPRAAPAQAARLGVQIDAAEKESRKKAEEEAEEEEFSASSSRGMEYTQGCNAGSHTQRIGREDLARRRPGHSRGRIPPSASHDPRCPPDAVRVDVAFKKPVFLPGTVAFGSAALADGWAFSLSNPRSGAPHLAGRTTTLGA